MNLIKPPFSVYLFDWDGCLVNTLPLWLKSYQTTFREFGFNPSVRTITTQVFGNWQGPKLVGVKDNDAFINRLLELVNLGYEKAPLHEQVPATLQALKRERKKLAIISSSERKSILAGLEYHHLTHAFDLIIAREDVTHHKPHPESINQALDFFNCDPSRAVMIGDGDKDCLAGQHAGVETVIFYPPANHPFYSRQFLKDQKPHHLITDFSQILNLKPSNLTSP